MATDTAGSVKAKALELGFDSVGITDLSPPPHGDVLRQWIADGMAANMGYMPRQAKRRLDPSLIFPGATRVVVATKNYFLEDGGPANGQAGKVARYARGKDYHHSIGERLSELADHILGVGDDSTIARTYVDAGPVPERELAQRAGLGWIGKNTMLIDPKAGSFFFIASVFTNLDLAVDAPFALDHCGSCRRCIEACPTQAIVSERVVDARLCISYLTIESKEGHPAELQSLMGDLVFGCDICQDVCPWNVKFAEPPQNQWLRQNYGLEWVELEQFATMEEAAFDQKYGTTPLERPGLKGMKRNVETAKKNQRDTK